MPDNELNGDNINKRPKRRAAQRTYTSYENTTVWNEDKDLKRALLASLQDVKKTVSKTTYEQNVKNDSSVEKKNTKSDVFTKLNSSSQSICKDVDNSLLSLAAHRRARVSAQRKFASGFSTNSPVSTPIKTGFVASTNVVDLFPNQKPKTEDFLTFLCLRRSPILPPNLDFIRLECQRKANEEKKCETDSENISNDELETNDKYTTCRLRASVDRRGSSSSTVSKTASVGSRVSLHISNRKKSENQRNINKIQNSKRHQFLSSRNGVKNLGPDLNQNVRQSQQNFKTNAQKSEETKNKIFDSLKQKYKQQRIDKKSSNPSKTLTSNNKNDSKIINKVNNFKDKKKSETIGIQTRQQLRNHSKNDNEFESKDRSNSKDNDSSPSERVLRSKRSIIVSHDSNDFDVQRITKTSGLQKTNSKKNKSLNSSQIGIRPKKRKARPMVPLIDYYFDSEFETDSEKTYIKKKENNSTNSQKMKTKNPKNNSKDNKSKKTSKPISEELRTSLPSHPKATKKSAKKSKTSLSSEPRRLTRSSRPFSPPKDEKDLERERLIKQRIIEIERKHKRLRRCPSNQSLHSSTSSSSSSSESLPNSLSSSSSINNIRLTRSLEHLKKIRDIAAKLKKEQNKKEEKNKNIIKNKVNNHKNKQNVNKRQNSIETQTSESLQKNTKTKKSIQRTVTRSMRDSVVSAMSDTDCDTEGDDCQDCEHLISGFSATEDSMASILDEDMERASIVIQDMAEDINSLLVNSSENDLQYGSTEHIQGLMTCEFSGAFSEETVATASAILLPTDCHSEYSYVQTEDSQIRSTVDASTNTAEEDILSSLSSDDTNTDSQYEYSSKTLSVGTQTTVNSSVQTDGSLDC